jgi:hypothetical protein
VQILLQGQIQLLKELSAFSTCLGNSNMLVLKKEANLLECQFIMGGLTRHVLRIRNKAFAKALQQLNAQGIIEGASFTALKHTFSRFSLHVKAKQLYFELSIGQPDNAFEGQQLAVA